MFQNYRKFTKYFIRIVPFFLDFKFTKTSQHPKLFWATKKLFSPNFQKHCIKIELLLIQIYFSFSIKNFLTLHQNGFFYHRRNWTVFRPNIQKTGTAIRKQCRPAVRVKPGSPSKFSLNLRQFVGTRMYFPSGRTDPQTDVRNSSPAWIRVRKVKSKKLRNAR